MTTHFTIPHIEKLLKEGKIRGYTVTPKNKAKGSPPFPKPSKEKGWISWNLKIWCLERGYELKAEYRFHPERKFRFDWAIPEIMIAIEYEGLMSEKSGHTTISGYTKDTEKYNLAQAAGWRIIRVTALNYKSVLTELDRLWNSPIK